MARAAPEIYRSIRNEGVASLRQWILEQYPIHQRSGSEFGHLFQSCCQSDFLLAGAWTEADLSALLDGSDQLEILLRDMGAFIQFIQERLTGDRVGGARMRVLNVPGPNADILPDWTINEGTLQSKVEHQRQERSTDRKKTEPKGQENAKDQKGKGKKKGGASAKAAAAPTQS